MVARHVWALQALDPLSEKVPRGHGRHSNRPLRAAYVFSGQSSQFPVPVISKEVTFAIKMRYDIEANALTWSTELAIV